MMREYIFCSVIESPQIARRSFVWSIKLPGCGAGRGLNFSDSAESVHFMRSRCLVVFGALLFLLGTFDSQNIAAAEKEEGSVWQKLFSGKNLEGWYIVIRNARSEDTNHL